MASSLLAALEISPMTSENWSRPMSIILSRVNSLPGANMKKERREGGREGKSVVLMVQGKDDLL